MDNLTLIVAKGIPPEKVVSLFKLEPGTYRAGPFWPLSKWLIQAQPQLEEKENLILILKALKQAFDDNLIDYGSYKYGTKRHMETFTLSRSWKHIWLR